MDVVDAVLFVAAAAYIHGGWLLYFREDSKYRDLATDVAQLIHDRDLSREDFRRAREHDVVERRTRE